MPARRFFVLIAAPMLALTAACSSGTSSAPTPEPTLDCAAVESALNDYGLALLTVADAVERNDAAAASTGAADLRAATERIAPNLPGLPPESQAFIDRSLQIAADVEAAAESGDLAGVQANLESVFTDEEMRTGGDAIDDIYGQACAEE